MDDYECVSIYQNSCGQLTQFVVTMAIRSGLWFYHVWPISFTLPWGQTWISLLPTILADFLQRHSDWWNMDGPQIPPWPVPFPTHACTQVDTCLLSSTLSFETPVVHRAVTACGCRWEAALVTQRHTSVWSRICSVELAHICIKRAWGFMHSRLSSHICWIDVVSLNTYTYDKLIIYLRRIILKE